MNLVGSGSLLLERFAGYLEGLNVHPLADGGENFPKSMYPAGELSAQTPTLAKADRTASATVSRMAFFILIPGVNGFGFIEGHCPLHLAIPGSALKSCERITWIGVVN